MHCQLLLEYCRLIRYLNSHPRLLFCLQLLLLLFFFLFAPVLFLDLPLQRLLDGILFVLFLFHHYGFFIAPLEYCPAGFKLQVCAAFQDFPSSHDLREITLGLHRILIQVGTIIIRVVGGANTSWVVSLVYFGSIDNLKFEMSCLS